MKTLTILGFLFLATIINAADVRVAVLDFDNRVHSEADEMIDLMGGDEGIAEKGALILNEQLAALDGIRVIDRRDFMRKLEQAAGIDDGDEVHVEPSFIHSAQLLRVDAVIRGTLMSVSSHRRIVNPTKEGEGIDFETITVRIMLQALDAIDGSVLAAAQGKQSVELRQTKVERVEMGADEILTMMEKALAESVDKLVMPLGKEIAARAKNDKVGVSVYSTDDPALVEIDGVLVGSTPLDGLQVYKGDHVLTVSRPNYITVTKRIVLNDDVKIRAPMLRKDLTAEELKEIYQKAEMKVYMTNGNPDLLIQTIE